MINLITPCARIENLPFLRESVGRLHQDWHWWVVCDMRSVKKKPLPLDAHTTVLGITPSEPRIGRDGFACGMLRNVALNYIHDGWVYSLDDDTIIHPDFEQMLLDQKDLVGFHVVHRNGTLYHEPTQEVNDSAGFAWRYECYPNARYEDYGQEHDQHFWKEAWKRTDERRRIIIKRPGGYYNYLRCI